MMEVFWWGLGVLLVLGGVPAVWFIAAATTDLISAKARKIDARITLKGKDDG